MMRPCHSCQRRSPFCRSLHAPSFPGTSTAQPSTIRLTASRALPGLAAAHSGAAGKLPCTPSLAQAAGEKQCWVPMRAVAGSPVSCTSSIQLEGKLQLLCLVDSPNNNLRLSLQLVSATVAGGDWRGVTGEETVLNAIIGGGETEMDTTISWDEKLGAPGAVFVKNHSDFPVYLKLLSCSLPSACGAVHFACNGWVYPVGKHPYRLFFTNDAYVKEKTPSALLKYREDELRLLRGDGRSTDEEPFQEWDRVYDYALYNDLGNPDLRKDLARPVLGGSQEYPHPRRIKTGRPPCKSDPRTESRVHGDQQIYLPCDERLGNPVVPAPFVPKVDGHFKSFAEIYSLLGLNELGQHGQAKGKFPVPQVISVNPTNWRTDEEFARQMLSVSNPVCIKRVMEFPLTSKLDRCLYGDQDSKITRDHIEKNMGAMTVEQAVKTGRLYVVDHHDFMMPFLKRINELPGEEERGEISPRKAYAARILLFLDDGLTLRPLAIELSSPHPEDEKLGAVSTVYTPPDTGDGNMAGRLSTWDLAKAHATVNDTCKNNFVYHWINIHANIEPLVIATNRQLSVLHPIHKLLKPHFRKTLYINTTARQIIFSAGDQRENGDIVRGIQEVTYLPSKYGLQMSSQAYRNWNFSDLALPRDLINRGMAKGDPRKPEKLELLIKDYPFAVDGLDLWIAIKKWVTDYCAIYYTDDDAVANDSELQAWWREVRHKGHGDLSEAPWWPSLDCLTDLEETCTIIIWLASAYHTTVGLGQFMYMGFMPNRPTITSRPMPEAGAEVTESDFLWSITPRKEALFHMAMTAQAMVLKGEVYLGQRQDMESWTSDERAAMALARYQSRLQAVADNIERRNSDPALRNRAGLVQVPYTRLMPTTLPGPVSGGIPNSVTN
ncbi:hypothetical protein EJB05_49981, partial [Eragrostis curvula]